MNCFGTYLTHVQTCDNSAGSAGSAGSRALRAHAGFRGPPTQGPYRRGPAGPDHWRTQPRSEVSPISTATPSSCRDLGLAWLVECSNPTNSGTSHVPLVPWVLQHHWPKKARTAMTPALLEWKKRPKLDRMHSSLWFLCAAEVDYLSQWNPMVSFVHTLEAPRLNGS